MNKYSFFAQFSLFLKHPKIFIYGIVVMLFSCFAQSYFISQFIPMIQLDFDMSRSEFANIYSFATLAASLFLVKIGKLLDQVALKAYGLFIAIGLACAFLMLSYSQHSIILFIAIFLIRGLGQTSLAMAATWPLGKMFGINRGKALSISNWGRSFGEGFLPSLFVAVALQWGWRQSYWLQALSVVVILIPVILYLAPQALSQQDYGLLYPERLESEKIQGRYQLTKWSWRHLIQHERSILGLMLSNSLVPFMLTGLFFQQHDLALWKGWTQEMIVQGFLAYAAGKILGDYQLGQLVDRYSAKQVQLFLFMPISLALLTLLTVDHWSACYVYMSILGVAAGMSSLVRDAFWAENMHGRSLGQIRAMDGTLLVLGTSLAPIFTSGFLDAGGSCQILVIVYLAICALGPGIQIFLQRLFFDDR